MKTPLRYLPLLVASLMLLAVFCAGPIGCAGAPKNLEQLEQMDETSWQAWLRRVDAWSLAAGYSLVDSGSVSIEDTERLAGALRLLAGEPSATVDLARAAEDAGLSAPLVLAALLEIDAMIGDRGGWPGGPRRDELLSKIADSLVAGAYQGAQGEESFR